MTPNEPTDPTTIVVGASRGLGRGIATALADAGAPVIAVARTEAPLAELVGTAGNITPEVADATDPTVTGTMLDRYEPQALGQMGHRWEAWSVGTASVPSISWMCSPHSH